MLTGIYSDMSNADYHDSDGISRSKLCVLAKTPKDYWYKYISGQFKAQNDTDCLMFGSLVHTLALEPHLYDDHYMSMPKIDRRTKEGKQLYGDYINQSAARILVPEDQVEKASKMVEALKSNDLIEKLIADSKKEQSIFFAEEETGLLCKARPDIWRGTIIADLKTVSDASYRNFQHDCVKYGYFLQAGMIDEALRAHGKTLDAFVFCCVEKEEPYHTAVYDLDREAIDLGRKMFKRLIKQLKTCIDTDTWPGYEPMTLTAPAYLIQNEEKQND